MAPGIPVFFPQAIVAIAGREAKVRVYNARRVKIAIEACPDCIEVLHIFEDGEDLVFTVLGRSYHPDRVPITFSLEQEASTTRVDVPVRVFTGKEFFVVACVQSNYHKGWDCSWLPQFYPDMVNGEPGFIARKKAGKVGPGVSGSSHEYLHDASTAKREYGIDFTPLETIFHDNGVPVSWLIDKPVAEQLAPRIVAWHAAHGDAFSVLPTSYFQDNAVNFNIEKTPEETKKRLKNTLNGVHEVFKNAGFPRYASVAGIDTWLGSIGSNFVRAAMDLGLRGLWGMGWDHEGRNGGMHHRGAPWEAYKPSKYQYRVPARENERFELFLFQWTVRDLVNTLHLSPQGATIFSSNPDDLKLSGIIKQRRPNNFIMEMLSNYHKNMKYNDYFVFIVHQADHDAHDQESNLFLKEFIEELVNEGPPGIVLATLEEVAQWLSIRYPDNEAPSQLLELDDPLDPGMRELLRETRMPTILQVYDPQDDDELARILVEHFPMGRLPVHLAYFDRDMMFLGYKPRHLPVQFWDYRLQDEWIQPEDGQYPMSILPRVDVFEEVNDGTYKVSFISDKFLARMPWIVWNPRFTLKPGVSGGVARQTDNAVVFFINVQAGENRFDFSPLIL